MCQILFFKYCFISPQPRIIIVFECPAFLLMPAQTKAGDYIFKAFLDRAGNFISVLMGHHLITQNPKPLIKYSPESRCIYQVVNKLLVREKIKHRFPRIVHQQ